MIKKTSLLFLVLLAALVSCREHECPDYSYTVVLKDTAIEDVNCNSAFPDVQRGTDSRIQTSAWTFSGSFGAVRIFLNFHLSSIPRDARITKAVLTMYADTTNVEAVSFIRGHSTLSGSNAWKVKRITSPWTENTITWNLKPTYDDVGAVSMPASTSNAQTYKIDITEFVIDQLRNPTLYYGVMFQLDTEVPYRQLAFCSKEHPYAAILMPTLEITYKK